VLAELAHFPLPALPCPPHKLATPVGLPVPLPLLLPLLQIQWMQQTDEAWPLQQEVEGEVDAAYRCAAIQRDVIAPAAGSAEQSIAERSRNS
jgi:hypothetical protein